MELFASKCERKAPKSFTARTKGRKEGKGKRKQKQVAGTRGDLKQADEARPRGRH